MQNFNQDHYEYACFLLSQDRDLTQQELVNQLKDFFKVSHIHLSSINMAMDWIQQARIYITNEKDFMSLLTLYYSNINSEVFTFNTIVFKNKFILDTLILNKEFMPKSKKLNKSMLEWLESIITNSRFYLIEHSRYLPSKVVKGKYLNLEQALLAANFKYTQGLNKFSYEICVV